MLHIVFANSPVCEEKWLQLGNSHNAVMCFDNITNILHVAPCCSSGLIERKSTTSRCNWCAAQENAGCTHTGD